MRPALILVPGLLCDAAVWQAQSGALAGLADVRVAAHAPLDSLEGMAEAIIAAAPARFAIAGHSMGGRIALEVARRVPERLTGLALLDSGFECLPRGEGGARETAGRHAHLDTARSEGMRAMARIWVQSMVYPGRLQDSRLIEGILEMFERSTPELFALQIRALLNRPDARAVLARTECPTLILCGNEDASAPPARHREMAALARDATLTVIPECGHMAPLEREQAVCDAMRAWLLRAIGKQLDES